MQTLKELSDRAGVSKTAIRKKLITLDLMSKTVKDEKGVVLVPDNIAELVVGTMKNQQKLSGNIGEPKVPHTGEPSERTTPESGHNAVTEQLFLSTLETMRAELAAQQGTISALQNMMNDQLQTINTLTATVNQLTGALERAQQLHAGTIAERLEGGADQTQTGPEIVEAETMQEAPAEPDQEHTAPVEASEPETTSENVPSRAEPPKQEDTPAAKRGGILRAIFRRRR